VASSGCVKRVVQGASSNSYFPTDELQDRTNDCRDPIQPRGPLARGGRVQRYGGDGGEREEPPRREDSHGCIVRFSAGRGQNSYRGLVKILPGAERARNYSQCDSLLLGDKCGAHTFPYLEVRNPSASVEHEASTSKISEDQLFYCKQRGISGENAVNMIVNGFCKEVFKNLPMEFAVEAQKLLGVSLEGAVG